MTTTRTLCAARGRRAAILGLGLGLGLAILLPSTARSALNIIEVTDLVDDADTANGTCTLREAIRSANTNLAVDACRAGSATSIDRIHVLPGTHVVDLTSGNDEDMAVTGDLDILGPTVIQGSSAEFSIIEASGAGGDDRLFHIQESAEEVHFERVALRGGNADDTARRGGVLLNEESGALGVELVDVEVSGGTADLGGGIYNEGNLVIRRSRITGNHTTFPPGLEGSHGGGIHSTDVGAGAQLTIEDSSISGNQAAFGGGLYVDSGALVLHRLQLVENEAIDGGGLYVATNGYDIDYVEISRNSADRGAGMFMAEQGEVQHSAFIDNEASTAGGGLYDGFGGFVRFSTFSANSAPTGAAAYADSGQTLFDSDTISRNFGTGVHNQSGAFFENTIVSENLDGNCSGNAPGFGAFNIEDMDTCGFVASAGGPNFPNTTPQIGPLGYNGGPTPTLPLLPGSPAVDAVSSEIRMNCEKMLDQRGHPRGRPRSQNGQGEDVYLCDIGAFEQTAPFVVDSLTDAVDADPEDDLCLTATGACTLRAAIQQANALPGLSEIELGAGAHVLSIAGAGEDAAATGDLDIDPPMLIRGAGADQTSVDGAGLDRVFDVGSPDHSSGAAPDRVVFRDLEITGGDAGSDNGGGIAARRVTRLERVALRANHAFRGSAMSGSATGNGLGGEEPFEIVESSVELNTGGMALYLNDARIDASTIADNTSTQVNGGAGEFITVDLLNSTVSGNQADATGAFFAQQAIVDSSTLYGNVADFSPGATFLLELSVFRNSVVAGNSAGGAPDNCSSNSGAVFSFGYNVTDTDAADCELEDPSDRNLTDPLLGLLADNGGPTRTHLPLAASPVIDTGDPVGCPETDQRGGGRPADGDLDGSAVCDVGAVELPEPGALAGLAAGAGMLVGLSRRRARRRPFPAS